jgi:hypothetical protein
VMMISAINLFDSRPSACVVIGIARVREGGFLPFFVLRRCMVLETFLAPKAVPHTGLHTTCGWGVSLPSIPKVHRGSTPGSLTHTHINIAYPVFARLLTHTLPPDVCIQQVAAP